MNAQKLTEKSLEAIQSANDMAISHQNQMIQQVHLLCALLERRRLVPQLFEKVGCFQGNCRSGFGTANQSVAVRNGQWQKSRLCLHRTGCRHGFDRCRKAGR